MTKTKDAVDMFFDALRIPDGGNRARVLYARAYAMSTEELLEARGRWIGERQRRLDKFVEMDAPRVIIKNERLMLTKGAAVVLLNKVLRERGI